jgi:hypothetical protein
MGWRVTNRMGRWLLSGLLLGTGVACEPPGSSERTGAEASPEPVEAVAAPPMATASYDAALQVPSCGERASGCDSGSLLDGRGEVGPEPHAPNTLGGTCLDGSSGTYHEDESIDRIRLYTTDGSELAPGKEVTVEVTLWAYSSGNRVDLYSAADANNPSWTLLTTLVPTGPGAKTLTATYTLPSDSTGLQAVRAVLRYTGASSACSGDGYNDRDDLAFMVSAGAP